MRAQTTHELWSPLWHTDTDRHTNRDRFWRYTISSAKWANLCSPYAWRGCSVHYNARVKWKFLCKTAVNYQRKYIEQNFYFCRRVQDTFSTYSTDSWRRPVHSVLPVCQLRPCSRQWRGTRTFDLQTGRWRPARLSSVWPWAESSVRRRQCDAQWCTRWRVFHRRIEVDSTSGGTNCSSRRTPQVHSEHPANLPCKHIITICAFPRKAGTTFAFSHFPILSTIIIEIVVKSKLMVFKDSCLVIKPNNSLNTRCY